MEYILIIAVAVISLIFLLKKFNRFSEKVILKKYYGTDVTKTSEKIFHTKISGVTKKNKDGSDRQKLIDRYLGNGEYLILEREPENKYDENAIAIYMTDGKKLGYLPSRKAVIVAKQMDRGTQVYARVKNITGGYEGKNYGVNINVYMSK